MKKKLLLVILTVALSASIAGCGRGSDDSHGGNGRKHTGRGSTHETEEIVEMEEETSAEAEEAEDAETEETDAGETSTNNKETNSSKENSTFEPVTFTADCCSITFTEINENGPFGYTIKALLENNSPDVNYMFSIEGAYANNLNANPFFAAEVQPMKKSNEEISLDQEAIDYLSGDVSKIEFFIKIYDADHFEEPVLCEEAVSIYPKGEKMDVQYERRAVLSDRVLVDNEDVKVTFIKAYNDELWGYTLLLYLENKTADRNVMYTIEDCSVNDFMVDPFWATSLHAGKTGYSKVAFFKNDFEDNGIDKVEDIAFLLRAYDIDNWTESGLAEEWISLQPK